jgi:hypothetical protein
VKLQIKGFTSLLLAVAFLMLGFSGVILYLTPRGRVANWTGWTMLGLDQQGKGQGKGRGIGQGEGKGRGGRGQGMGFRGGAL